MTQRIATAGCAISRPAFFPASAVSLTLGLPDAGEKREKECNIMILADKIIDLRKKNGWSQEELAEKLGVSRQAVSKWRAPSRCPIWPGCCR